MLVRSQLVRWRFAFCESTKKTDPATPPAVVVDIPVMGESITEGSIEVLNVAVGDAVAVDDVIGSIETDKVPNCCLWELLVSC